MPQGRQYGFEELPASLLAKQNEIATGILKEIPRAPCAYLKRCSHSTT